MPCRIRDPLRGRCRAAARRRRRAGCTVAQLRLRVADNCASIRATIMPSYYKVAGLERVAAPYADKPILTAREVEDIVA